MARYILDASAFVKSVIPETGSDRVHELIAAAVARSRPWISDFG